VAKVFCANGDVAKSRHRFGVGIKAQPMGTRLAHAQAKGKANPLLTGQSLLAQPLLNPLAARGGGSRPQGNVELEKQGL
jgi:hypothetical protein